MHDMDDFKYDMKKIAEMHDLEEAYRTQDALKKEWEEGGSREDFAEAFETYLTKLREFV